MIPLISKSLYENLQEVGRKLPQESGCVFVSVSQPQPNLLFVGQATAGEDYSFDLDYAAATNECGSMLECFLDDAEGHIFWSSVHRIRDQVNGIAGESKPSVAIGWSNLYKIAGKRGNPRAKLEAVQRDLCIQALQEELRTAKPTVTIFLTGHCGQDEIFYPAMGQKGWQNNVASSDRIAVKEHPEFGLLLWGYHPRDPHGMKYQWELEAFIAGFCGASAIHHG